MTAPLTLGRVLATPRALHLVIEAGENPFEYLARHASGDWGELDHHDQRENELSVKNGWRVISAYPVGERRIWVITEADRSVTIILLPEEY